MAIVAPVTENTVRLQPLPGERLQAADFGGGREIVQGAQRLGNAVQDVALQLRDKYDEAAVKNALNASQIEVLEAKNEYLTREGKNAPGVLSEAQKRFNDIKANYSGKLSSARQRAMFVDTFDARTASDFETIGLHENKQVMVWHKAEARSTMEISFNSAVAEAPINPEKAEAYIATGIAQLAIMNPGAGAEEMNLAKSKYVSAYNLSVARSFAERGGEGVVKAEEWIKKAGAAVLPDDQTAFYKSYQPQLEAVSDDAAFGAILSGDPIDRETGTDGPVAADTARNRTSGITTQELVTGSKRSVSSPYGAARGAGKTHGGADYPRPEGSPAYSPAAGTVLKNYYDEKGGWSVLIRHADGRVSGYAHLRAKSPLEPGQTVERGGVVGAVGSTGSSSSGPHLHYTVRNAEGNKVDPEKQQWHDMPSAARTATSRRDLPEYKAERVDEARLLDRVRDRAVAEGWSSDKYERMVKRVQGYVNVQDGLRERAFNDADERVSTQVDNLGDKFTSITQIDVTGLRPGAITVLRNRAEANRDGTEIAKSGSDRYFTLLEMATNPARQNDFLKVPPTQLMQGVSKGEYTRLRTMQIEARNAPPGKGLDTGRLWAEVNRVLPAKKDDKARERDRRILLDRLLSAVRSKGTEVQDEELLGLTTRLVRDVVNTETGIVAPLYKQTGTVRVGVPAAFAARVAQARKAQGLPPFSDADMRAYWTYRGAPAQ